MKSKKYGWLIVSLLGALSLFNLSCKKEKPVDPGHAKVRFVNTYQNSNPQNFYQEDTKLSNQALAYGQYGSYHDVIGGYSVFWANDALLDKATSAIDAVLYDGYQYTFFYYVNVESKPLIAGYINEQKAPAAGKFRVRFLNICTAFDGKPLKIVDQNNQSINSDLQFGDNPVYMELPVNTEMKVNIRDAAKITTIAANNFQEGKTYLIWFDTNGDSDVQYHIVPQD